MSKQDQQRLKEAGSRRSANARSACEGVPAREARPNLEYSTQIPDRFHPGYSCTVLDFGDSIELRAVFVRQPPPKNRKTTSERVNAVSSCYEDPERREYRVRRTKRLCKWRIKAIGKRCRLWTLTKRGKFDSTDHCYAVITAWVKSIQGWSDKEFRYVAVPEQHADGTWHVHIAVDGFWDVNMLRRFWYRALGGTGLESGSDTPGGINIAPLDARKNASAAVASYIGKYISKSFGILGKGKRSFWASKGLQPKKIIRFMHPFELNGNAYIWLREWCEQYRPGKYTVYDWDFAGTSGVTIKSAGS